MRNLDFVTIGQTYRDSAASGTIPCANARAVNISLDYSQGIYGPEYDDTRVFAKAVSVSTGTVSITSASGVVNGRKERTFYRPHGANNWWVAWATYSASGSSFEMTVGEDVIIIVEKLG